MFIDPPEGCKGQPVNLDNVATYGASEHYAEDGWVIAFSVSGRDSRVEWPFPNQEAALEGMAYIRMFRDCGRP